MKYEKFALIVVGMCFLTIATIFVSAMTSQSSRDKVIIACYESGKLECETIDK